MLISNGIGNVSASILKSTHKTQTQTLKIIIVHHSFLVVTILIGPNDFCLDFCYQNEPERSADNHRRDLIQTLRILRDNLPRTIVNVVTPPSKCLFVCFTTI